MSATLRDIAKASGVSVMSACAVLTGGGGPNVRVSPAKANLIREKARELHYEPNVLGRSLRTRRTDTIGVVLHHLTSFGDEPYYYHQLLDGIMAAIFPRAFTLSLCPVLAHEDGVVRIAHGQFDGILWCCPDLYSATTESVKSLRVPLVMVHAPAETAQDVPTFAADNDSAMRRVVVHLAGLGHESIGFVVKPHIAQTSEGRARTTAFLASAKELGIRAEVLLWEHDVQELESYASGSPRHTALAAYNDVHAGLILSHAARLGIRVPQDLSVVGFDSSNYCDRTQPPLTSVHQPIAKIARDAADCLIRIIDAQREGVPAARQPSAFYDCSLDIRGSTAAPAPRSRGN